MIYSNNVYDQLCSSKTYGATDYYNVAPYEMLEFSPSVVFSPGQDDQSVRVEFRIISAKNKVLWSSVLTSASPPELVQVPIAGQQIVGLETSALDPGSCAEVFAAFLGPRLSTP